LPLFLVEQRFQPLSQLIEIASDPLVSISHDCAVPLPDLFENGPDGLSLCIIPRFDDPFDVHRDAALAQLGDS
jgi:hypothetical protein